MCQQLRYKCLKPLGRNVRTMQIHRAPDEITTVTPFTDVITLFSFCLCFDSKVGRHPYACALFSISCFTIDSQTSSLRSLLCRLA